MNPKLELNEIAEVKMLNENILLIRFMPKTTIDVAEAELVYKEANRISEMKKHANLVDTRDMLFMTSAGRKYFGAKRDKSVIAIGVVINSVFQGALANMYMRFATPKIPTKMFTDEKDAVNWLNTFF